MLLRPFAIGVGLFHFRQVGGDVLVQLVVGPIELVQRENGIRGFVFAAAHSYCENPVCNRFDFDHFCFMAHSLLTLWTTWPFPRV